MKKTNGSIQMSLFDYEDKIEVIRRPMADYYNKKPAKLNDDLIDKLNTYNLDKYIEDVTNLGLEKTWDYICEYVLKRGENKEFLNIANFGEMYEIGLAVQDKLQKKKSGQYYTPDDVASVMSNWLKKCNGENVCDVACGTGKLILTYLDLIGEEETKKLIKSGRLYLYDFDHVALKICKTAIVVKYKIENPELIHDIYCDFLDRAITLPENAKVISNPPYAAIEKIEDYWIHSEVLMDTKELYSSFMEKIFKQAVSTVIITPFSFISGNKFYSLRKEMCELGSGFVVSFDNVPGNIFCGRKHGVFNTNTANSVRAAITVLNKSENKGFRISPLIRFKNEERNRLLTTDVLEMTLPEDYQIIDNKNDSFRKVFKELNSLYDLWVGKSQEKLINYISKHETNYLIDMPNTCRYYTTASSRKLKRNGSITMYFKDEDVFNFIYCFINSSFTYWWWRIYDGGITYPVSLLNSMPLPFKLLSEDDKTFFASMCKEKMEKENEFIITKANAGAVQENIKFPDNYRQAINERIIKILGSDTNKDLFDLVHANKFFGD